MRFISTRIHGVLDYLVGILLIAAPWLLGFYKGGAESWVPILLGAMTLVYSLMTNYELGAIKRLSMPTHLIIDLVSGVLLAASPWLFGFSDLVYVPHVVVGIFEVVVSLLTSRVPSHMSASSAKRPATAM